MAAPLSTKQSEVSIIVHWYNGLVAFLNYQGLVAFLNTSWFKLISKQYIHKGAYSAYISNLGQVSSTIYPPDVLDFNLIIFQPTQPSVMLAGIQSNISGRWLFGEH